MNSHSYAPGQPAPSSDTVNVVGRFDGSTVTVGTQPDPSGTSRVVLLRVHSPTLDVLTTSFLAADEAHLLATALSSAASAAADEPPACSSRAFGGPVPRAAVGRLTQHIVCAAEDTTVAELARALGSVPAHGRLTDFASDVDVTLIFTSPQPGPTDPTGTPDPTETRTTETHTTEIHQ